MNTVFEMGALLFLAPGVGIVIGSLAHELFRRWVND
jgi:hypothetical protein